MPSIECSIVIIDQYYENNHYHHYNGKCMKGSGNFLSITHVNNSRQCFSELKSCQV